MRLSKQLGQIFQLANEFHNDESDSVGVAVDVCLGPSNKIKSPLRNTSKRALTCSGRESNPYGHFCPRDFKSRVSTYSTTRAVRMQR